MCRYELASGSSIFVWAFAAATAYVGLERVIGIASFAYLIGILLAIVALRKRAQNEFWLASVGFGLNAIFCLAALALWLISLGMD
jgi:hypothetical protein